MRAGQTEKIERETDNKGIMSEEIGSDESYDRKAVSESRWQV